MALGVAVLGTGRIGGLYIDVVKATAGVEMLVVAEPRDEPVESTDSLEDEFADFVEAIERGDEDTPIPQAHGRQVIQVLEATEESARTGREVVLSRLTT